MPESQEHKKYLKKMKKTSRLILISQVIILLSFFAAWEAAAAAKIIDPFIFSSPSRVLKALWGMIANGSLFVHTGITLGETLIGFLISTALGTLSGIALWWNKSLEKVLNPYLVVLNALPKTALAPIIIVWMGNNTKSVVATSVMTAIIVTILTVLNGFLEVDKDKIKLIETFRGTKMQTLTKVILPASLPSIMSAVKINIGMCFVGVVVGEFLVANAGLGYLIVYGSQIFKMDWVLLSIIVLCFLAAILYKLAVYFEKKFMNWNL